MTILMNQDKSLIITKYNVIRHNDSNVADILYFLFPQEYEGIDLSNFSASLFYQIPNGDSYTVQLIKDEELYKDKIKFTMPYAEDFTKFAGDVQLKIILSKVVNDTIYYLHTGELNIKIEGIKDYFVDPTAGTIEHIEQELAQINARIDNTANNILLDTETNQLYLSNSGVQVGSSIGLEDLGSALVDSNEKGLIKVII
mgnify:CR=1 FL=1